MYITFGWSNTDDPTTIGTTGVTQSLWITAADFGRAFAEGAKYGGGKQRHSRMQKRDCEVKFWPFSKYAQDAYPDGQDVEDLEAFQDNFRLYKYCWITACTGLDPVEGSTITFPIQVVPVAALRATQDDAHANKKLTVRFEGTSYL